MNKKISRRNLLVCILALVSALLVLGLSGCKNTEKDSAVSEDPVMRLFDQPGFFKGAPEELYFGTASQDSYTDQGVTLKYLASFHDGEATYIFFDLIDTGDVLFGNGSLGFNFSYDFLEKTGYNDSRQNIQVSYNEDTRTATYCVEYIGPLQTDALSFHIYSMTGWQKKINTTFQEIDLYEILKETPGEFELEESFVGNGTSFGIFDEQTGSSKTVEMPDFEEGNQPTIFRLSKDALALPVKDEDGNQVADITNIGWRNGWLHIQINPDNDIDWAVDFNLKNNNTGELLYSPFNLSFGAAQDSATQDSAAQDGAAQDNYYEYVFYVGDLTDENLDYSIAFINSAYPSANLAGDWSVNFSIPDSLLYRLEANKLVPMNDQEFPLQRAVISPVNISLFASRKDVSEGLIDSLYNINAEDLNLKIIYRDGKTVDVPKESGQVLVNQKGSMFRFAYTADNFNDISGLEVNGVLFPVPGD